ncbi:hypothetical protein EBR96_01535 [bacterium]|nr:hypothetical protein [bacterium]
MNGIGISFPELVLRVTETRHTIFLFFNFLNVPDCVIHGVMKRPISIGFFGATGLVGRHLVKAVTEQSDYDLRLVVGSSQSEGRSYAQVWREKEAALAAHYGPIWTELSVPDSVQHLEVASFQALLDSDVDLIISSVPERVGAAEITLAESGKIVVSNSPHLRIDPRFPLVISPEELRFGAATTLVKVPNCAVIGITSALRPISKLLETSGSVIVGSTYQSLSGRGDAKYPIEKVRGNVYPLRNSPEAAERHISSELLRLFPALRFSISAYRVYVQTGHLIDIAIHHDGSLRLDALKQVWDENRDLGIRIDGRPGHPAPSDVLDSPNDMAVIIGNMSADPELNVIRFSIVLNNLIRGAAGTLISVGTGIIRHLHG